MKYNHLANAGDTDMQRKTFQLTIAKTHHCEVAANVFDKDEVCGDLRLARTSRGVGTLLALARVQLGADFKSQVGEVEFGENPGIFSSCYSTVVQSTLECVICIFYGTPCRPGAHPLHSLQGYFNWHQDRW